VLAVCGGGSDAAALLIVALAVAVWVGVVVLVVRTARDRREQIMLIAVTLVASTVGAGVLFGLLEGFDGDNEQLPVVILTLLLPGLAAAGIAVAMRLAHAGRAFFLALWGAIFIPSVYILLVISLLAIGSACLD
jgi:hypothetical protein